MDTLTAVFSGEHLCIPLNNQRAGALRALHAGALGQLVKRTVSARYGIVPVVIEPPVGVRLLVPDVGPLTCIDAISIMMCASISMVASYKGMTTAKVVKLCAKPKHIDTNRDIHIQRRGNMLPFALGEMDRVLFDAMELMIAREEFALVKPFVCAQEDDLDAWTSWFQLTVDCNVPATLAIGMVRVAEELLFNALATEALSEQGRGIARDFMEKNDMWTSPKSMITTEVRDAALQDAVTLHGRRLVNVGYQARGDLYTRARMNTTFPNDTVLDKCMRLLDTQVDGGIRMATCATACELLAHKLLIRATQVGESKTFSTDWLQEWCVATRVRASAAELDAAIGQLETCSLGAPDDEAEEDSPRPASHRTAAAAAEL